MIYTEKTVKFAIPAIIALVVVLALVFGTHRGEQNADEDVTTTATDSSLSQQTEGASSGAGSQSTASTREDDAADFAQNDAEMDELQELLDDDAEEESLAKAKELAASKTDKHRAFALKAFEWYGGLDNLAEIAKLTQDSNFDIADAALDSYENTFRALQVSPDSKTLNTLAGIIHETHDSERLNTLFGLFKNVDEATALPTLIGILQKANEAENDELADLATETIDFLTEQDSGIDSLEKAQEWLDKQARENAGN
jgi:hypothetical protein